MAYSKTSEELAAIRSDRQSHIGRADEISIYALLRVVLQYRAAVVIGAIVGGALFGGSALLSKRRYTSEATFMPQATAARAAGGGLAALAGQFGVNVLGNEPAQSPQFYAELVTSRQLIGRMLNDTFDLRPTSESPDRGTLAEILKVRAGSVAERREKTIRTVASAISASVSREIGIVRVSVTTRWPMLSAAIAERLIALVNEFNLRTRQTNAASEVRFVEGRLREAEGTLREAERTLQAFLETNRQYQGSPQLVFEHDRLERRVNQQHEIVNGLQQSLESARIAEVRDIPVITVVERPEPPVYPDSRGTIWRGLIGILLGALAGLFIGLAREIARQADETQDPEYRKLREAWSQARAGFKVTGRRLADASERRANESH